MTASYILENTPQYTCSPKVRAASENMPPDIQLLTVHA